MFTVSQVVERLREMSTEDHPPLSAPADTPEVLGAMIRATHAIADYVEALQEAAGDEAAAIESSAMLSAFSTSLEETAAPSANPLAALFADLGVDLGGHTFAKGCPACADADAQVAQGDVPADVTPTEEIPVVRPKGADDVDGKTPDFR